MKEKLYDVALAVKDAQPKYQKEHIPVGELGFYTEDADVFEARMAEIEAELDRAEQGDESDWGTAEEFDIELRKEFPWLR